MPNSSPSTPALLLALLGLLSAGCASPSARFDRIAAADHFGRAVMQGGRFEHVIYRRDAQVEPSRQLHVYLGGDGSPWSGNRPSGDPTPREPLALRLMALDPGRGIYVGRPCYHGLHRGAPCDSKDWTSARYSSAVIDSMAVVINEWVRTAAVEEVVLIGYSGGGAIAVLLAPRVSAVSAVITVAANLDTDAWVAHHRFDPLTGSLNPALQPPLPVSVRQIHLVAENDRIVPPATSQRFFHANATAARYSYADFDHRCCWETVWPEVLALLAN